MTSSKFLQVVAATGLALAVSGSAAAATTIDYSGTLRDGVAVTGSVSSSAGPQSTDSGLVDYWSFSGEAGNWVTITGQRLEDAYDMSFWLISGVFTDDSGWVNNPEAAPGLLGFYDDQISRPGPYGDPYVELFLPTTGLYTLLVTNFDSGWDGGDGLFPYQLTATGVAAVPVPAAGLLLMGALGGLAALRRRKTLA